MNGIRTDCDCTNDPACYEDGVVIWGRIKTQDSAPIAGALVHLLRFEKTRRGTQLVSVAHTKTDRKGFYQFEIDEKFARCAYRILASKAAEGRERVVDSLGCCRY